MGKSKKDASTDSGLGASAQTLVLRRINNIIPSIIFVTLRTENETISKNTAREV